MTDGANFRQDATEYSVLPHVDPPVCFTAGQADSVARRGFTRYRSAVVDDILVEIFGRAVFGRLGESRRAQLLARVFFGLLGTVLCTAGAVHFVRTVASRNTAMSMSMVAMFVFLAAFCLFNVALGRTWRWPGVLFVVSFVSLFVTRILFGA